MLPEHKNSVNGRNNQGNTKIILDPIQILNQQENNSSLPDDHTTTIINFQTQIPINNYNHDNYNNIDDDDDDDNDDNHITTLGGSTPKKNHFTTKTNNKNIKKSSSLSVNNRKIQQNNRNNNNHHISCISFQDNFTENQHRRGRRLNGLQLPLHPLQVFGWIILILFGLASFIILIPTFTIELQQPLYGLLAGLYIVHTISHLAAVLIDPADCELRRIHRNDRIVPEFDRTKHSHVIENGRCHLCNIRTTSNRTKHCSVCNKCVGKFDHHCKWLNHCIGDRNYVAFLMCVVSAVIATLVILAAAIAQIILFYVNPSWLNLWYLNDINNTINNTNDSIQNYNNKHIIFTLNDSLILTTSTSTSTSSSIITSTDDIFTNFIDNTLEILNQTFDDNDNITNLTSIIAEAIVTEITNDTSQIISSNDDIVGKSTTTTAGGISLHDTIFLIFTGVIGLLAAITAGLLLHLCFFHIYISFLGLTTYEYIRNHRQNLIASNVPTNNVTTSTGKKQIIDPKSKLITTKRNSKIYFCSSLKHPNDTINLNTNQVIGNERPTTLHCCENSREYHQQTSMKTIYMCSLLEESSSTTTTTTTNQHQHFHNNDDNNIGNRNNDTNKKNTSKTFHCCSQFQKNESNDIDDNMQRRRTASTAATILHFTEQCTFCTFRVKKTPTKSVEAMSIQDKRCCLKTITKHHRWRRKWNCCSNVPDSPDVPNDIISTISTTIPTNNVPNSIFYQQQSYNNRNNNLTNNNPTQIPPHFTKTNGNDNQQQQQQQQQQQSAPSSRKTTRPKLVRPWPVTRFRHMLRMIGRYRRPHCRHAIGVNAVNIGAVKQNQVRPLVNIQQHNNSSGDSSDTGSITSDSTIQSIETILPTSVIRDGIYMPGELTMPVLPPPTRRKMANPTDLDELAETLGFSYTPSIQQQHQQQRFPNPNSIYRRQRRKNLLRTRSPTLSPIHESGLSNPTSPQPCRHVVSSCAGTIVNNSCGTGGSSVITSGNDSRFGKD